MLKLNAQTLFYIISVVLLSFLVGCTSDKSIISQSDNELTIGIFWPPVWEQTNIEQYRIIKEANVDYIQNVLGSLLDSEERNIKMLELAEQCKLKMYVADPRVKGSEEDIKSMIETYRKFKAVSGYYIVDEPGIDGLEDAAMRYKAILSYAPDAIPYVNLFPHWAGPVADDYENKYVKRWIELCGKENMKYLSFDSYPFMDDGGFRDSHYLNLDIIRKVGLENNIKTSCYAQSVGIPGAYKRPSATDLRFSGWSSLAYGIKNIVWFTYWTPTNRGEVFTNAIIDSMGMKTALYESFKQINGEMKQLGKTLANLDAVAVYHVGNIPEGCPAVSDDFIFKPESLKGDFIVSHFINASGDEYVMIVNKSLSEAKSLSIRLNDKYKKVEVISPLTGDKEQIKLSSGNSLPLTLPPGDARLYHVR